MEIIGGLRITGKIDPIAHKANIQVGVRQPFFSGFLGRTPVKETFDIPRMATDSKYIYYNPDFIHKPCPYCTEILGRSHKHTFDEVVWTFWHEHAHNALNHCFRMMGRDQADWNWSADAFINENTPPKIGTPPVCAVRAPEHKGKSAEQIYWFRHTKKKQEEARRQQEEEEKRKQQESEEDTGYTKPGESNDDDSDSDTNSDDGASDQEGDETDSGEESGDSEGGSSDNRDSDESESSPGNDSDDADNGEESESNDSDDSDGEGESDESGDETSDESSSDESNGHGSPSGEEGEGEGGAHVVPEYYGDVLPVNAENADDRKEQEQNWEMAIQNAITVAMRQCKGGDIPGWLGQLAKEKRTPKEDWRAVVDQFFDPSGCFSTSYMQPNRKYMGSKFVIPGFIKDRVNEMLVFIDASGSTCSEMTQKAFRGELQGLLDSGKIDKLIVAFFDTRVYKVVEYTEGDELAPFELAGGGTLFTPSFEWAEENYPDVNGIVFFTDMEPGDKWDDMPEPNCPVLWCGYGNPYYLKHAFAQVKFGDCIDINDE